MMRDKPAQFQATVKSVKTGYWAIEARAYYYSPGSVGDLGVASTFLYTSISQESAIISDMPFPDEWIPKGKSGPPPPEIPPPRGPEDAPYWKNDAPPELPLPPTPTPAPELPTAVSPPTGAIKVQLSFSDYPVLGKPVCVFAKFWIREGYKKDATNTVAEILLEEGFELVDGNIKWTGDLMRGSSAEIKATIKSVKTGECILEARAIAYTSEGKSYTHGHTDLYAYVSEDSATVSDIPLKS